MSRDIRSLLPVFPIRILLFPDLFFFYSHVITQITRCHAPLILGTNSQPPDFSCPIGIYTSRPAALDVMAISTLQPLTLAGAAATQGHALR